MFKDDDSGLAWMAMLLMFVFLMSALEILKDELDNPETETVSICSSEANQCREIFFEGERCLLFEGTFKGSPMFAIECEHKGALIFTTNWISEQYRDQE